MGTDWNLDKESRWKRTATVSPVNALLYSGTDGFKIFTPLMIRTAEPDSRKHLSVYHITTRERSAVSRGRNALP